jgi:hypothetical protein
MGSTEPTIGNIGGKERTRLRLAGIVGLALAAGLAVVAVQNQVAWWVHVMLFVTLWSGFSALLQARERTSILLAARRVRRIDGKEEPERFVLLFRGRARMIYRRSLLAAVFLMTLVTLFY